MRVSACIECATSILGERLRCPRCQDEHAQRISDRSIVITGLRDRDYLQRLLALVVLIELALAALMTVYAVRGG